MRPRAHTPGTAHHRLGEAMIEAQTLSSCLTGDQTTRSLLDYISGPQNALGAFMQQWGAHTTQRQSKESHFMPAWPTSSMPSGPPCERPTRLCEVDEVLLAQVLTLTLTLTLPLALTLISPRP